MFGDKLRILRKQNGYSLRELGEKLNLSHTAINKFEKDLLKPDSKILNEICQLFNVKAGYFFYKPKMELNITEIKYRKRSNIPKKDIEIIEFMTREKLEKYYELKSYFPENRFKSLDISKLSNNIENLEEIEKAAVDIRKKLEIGEEEIPNLIETLEENGFYVDFIEPIKGFDAKQGYVNGNPFIMLSDNKSGDRQRFNLAHELGHILIKHNENFDYENVADIFAGCFLVPQKSLIKELGEKRQKISLHELGELKKKYRVSMQSIIMRAFQTGIISEKTKVDLFKLFAFKGWRGKEPIQIELEKTDRFTRLVCEAVVEGYISESKGAEYLNIRTVEFVEKYLNEIIG